VSTDLLEKVQTIRSIFSLYGVSKFKNIIEHFHFYLVKNFFMSLEKKTFSGVFQSIFKDHRATQLFLLASAVCAINFILR
jgi:hypothetical protein